MNRITALIADDEPLLRTHLRAQLATFWPALHVVADARNGGEAIDLFDAHQPDIVFLDVHMPGINGIDVARALAGRTQIVFITAYDQYAVQAFEHGAIDYLVKPVDAVRLAATVERLRARLSQRGAHGAGQPGAGVLDAGYEPGFNALLERMAQALAQRAAPRSYLQWIRASLGSRVRLISAAQVAFLRADEKYTVVAWDEGEVLIRKSIRELADELDPDSFVQIHRAVIVNLHYVSDVVRGINETAEVHLRGRADVLPVSRSYLHHFRQM